MDVVYKLLEGSWGDDAVIWDVERGICADPDKVHDIDHDGEFYPGVVGPHLCEPSRQRTPVLFQAGSSDRGREFAARHAEATFIVARTSERIVGAPEQVADALQEWADAGVDGINLTYAVTPGTFEDFLDHVVPVLQDRGLVQREYREGTLREKLSDGATGPRLPARHPAARRRTFGAPVAVA